MNLALIVVLSGVLATASPGVLERVEDRRVANGWGLTDHAPSGVVLIALEDCGVLGADVLIYVAGERQPRKGRVVDCQAAHHRAVAPLSGLGIVADVNMAELNHRQAVVVLRPPGSTLQ